MDGLITHSFSFTTDTATLCVYDLGALKHRLSDDPDWWCLASDELAELNLGNVAFIGLGSDGRYSGKVLPPGSFIPSCSVNLSCPSGSLFIGAGEEVTSDGLEATCLRGGMFLTVPPGAAVLQVAQNEDGELLVSVSAIHGSSSNSFDQPLRLTN